MVIDKPKRKTRGEVKFSKKENVLLNLYSEKIKYIFTIPNLILEVVNIYVFVVLRKKKFCFVL